MTEIGILFKGGNTLDFHGPADSMETSGEWWSYMDQDTERPVDVYAPNVEVVRYDGDYTLLPVDALKHIVVTTRDVSLPLLCAPLANRKGWLTTVDANGIKYFFKVEAVLHVRYLG